ncbi:MAG: phosphoribosylformylglycinamidine synthase subunit PurS [Candidatus Methylarchaceae archaeon HK02M2]|nr:phosphoribosylformylglycinamidine synthase subunit PurS [Candidatus Methylarchaceae archaeon HK01B]MCP8323545.1 phosphoribosylformylglycinamidine synthase subunit PurS [Candidatus Methylarchaceae archaeon HK02M2]
MKTYLVKVVIENKASARDPEGETILRDLLIKGGYGQVKIVRTAKLLKVWIDAETSEDAKNTTSKLCDELRIYNPVAHTCSISVDGE